MRVSLRWLRQYLKVDLEPDALLDCLTNLGLEIEDVVDLGERSGLLLVGEVKSVGRHPNADKLTLCEVDIGRGEPLSIVCGATNQKPGNRVPVALPGVTLPNGVTLKRTKIRGVESEGMMCAGAELGWGDDATGILILPDEWKIGEPVDLLFEVSITANRPDCMSVFGLARDIAAAHRKKIYHPTPRLQELVEHVEQIIDVTVKDKDLCQRYVARLLRNVRVGPSPLWMVRALESVGLRSINNVVDVTNFVLMELGHPLHAFDAEMIAEREIIVRRARGGETLETLDASKLTLDEEDLVIADAQRPIALAGVMGGANSQVTESTTTVVLEAAIFDPIAIRRTSKRHDLVTDSSLRFERGADLDMPVLAINRAAQLIREIADGEVAKGFIDIQPTIAERSTPIPLRLSRIERLLGFRLAQTEVADLLVNLGCEIPRADREQFIVTPPSWRVDLEREIDLIEEIARIHGYDRVPTTLPAVVGQPRRLPPGSEATEPLSRTLVAEGHREVVNFSFMAEALLERAGHGGGELVIIRNPLTRDHGAMRPSVLISLLANTQHNLHRGAEDVRLFEIGTAFMSNGAEAAREWMEVAAVAAGETPATWDSPGREHDFHAIKGVAEQCLRAVGVRQWQVKPLEDRRYHPLRAATLNQGNVVLVRCGELHPDYLEAFDISRRVCALELPLAPLVERAKSSRTRHAEFSRHPSVSRDLALVVDESAAAGDLANTVSRAAGDLLESIRLFDVYTGDNVEKGKKSLAFALVFRAPDRTLRDEEVQAALDEALTAARKRHGAELRS